jgi:hypothetical protein
MPFVQGVGVIAGLFDMYLSVAVMDGVNEVINQQQDLLFAVQSAPYKQYCSRPLKYD